MNRGVWVDMPETKNCSHCQRQCYPTILNRSEVLFEDEYFRIFHSQKRCLDYQSKSVIETLQNKISRLENDIALIKGKMNL